jgi:Domain of unknown function (DUF4345)
MSCLVRNYLLQRWLIQSWTAKTASMAWHLRYTVLRCVLWVFFAAGIARLVSVAIHGLPPPLVLALLVSELTIPPVLVLWLNRVVR